MQFLLPRCLQQSRIRCVVSAWVSRQVELTFSTFCNIATCPFTEPYTARFRFRNLQSPIRGRLRVNCSVKVPPSFRFPWITHKPCFHTARTLNCTNSVLLVPYTDNLNLQFNTKIQFNSCFSYCIMCKCQAEGHQYTCVLFYCLQF
jgi:hypothetical protein